MNGSLVNQLIKQEYLKTPSIIDAFKKVKRADFVPADIRQEYSDQEIADYNAPMEIGFGQTISQPLTVAFMLELLQPQKGDMILDIGSGSGWQTAMLASIAGEKGFVYAVELIPQLKEFGASNIKKYHFENVEFICADGSRGLGAKAPFDKIIAAASADKLPLKWIEQLKTGGRLVCSIKNSIWLYLKKKDGGFESIEHKGFVFVPLICNE